MRCYKCNAVLSDHDYCLKCGADVSVYKTVVRTSNSYYNMALAKAQVRDLSGAVSALKTSLHVYKNNIKARNLLGLVYFEMGEVAMAISEWVVSINLKPEKNVAEAYLRKVKSNQNKLEAYNQATKKYNFSLKKVKEDGDDVALIQLKKVVSMNPKFVKAMLLLALIYMKNGEDEKAIKQLNKVLKIDRNNTLALRYVDEINKTGIAKEGAGDELYYKGKKKSALSGNDVILPKNSYKEPSSGVLTVIYILLGVVIGVALVWFLVVPAKIQSEQQENNELIKQYSEQLAGYSVDITELENKNTKLATQLATAQLELDGYAGEGGELSMYAKLVEATLAYVNNDFETAAVLLAAIEVDQLPTDNAKSLYTTMSDNSTGGAQAFYRAGVNAYTQENYVDAITYFLRAYEIDTATVETPYYLAMSYIAINDFESANEYINIVYTKFGNTTYAAQLAAYLESLQTGE